LPPGRPLRTIARARGREREATVPRYLFIATYSPQGAKTVLATGGTARRTAIEKMLTGLGGRLESFDFAFGSDDVFLLCDLPDARSAAAVSLTLNGSGVASTRTVVLMSPEELDDAVGIHPDYRPPTAN
jgi:uncharacterized protein with GYD domain